MLRKGFLVPVLASVALLAVTVDVAQAQLLRGRTTRAERRDARRGIVYTPVDAEQVGMAPTQVTTTAMARISYYPTPANTSMDNCCQIRVILPNAQAKVWFDGKATTSMGTSRLFETPALPTTAPSNYTVKCTFMLNGQEVTREQVVACNPNTLCVVDFTLPTPR
jgi:uncharacterized protein (TIGR03000 family)